MKLQASELPLGKHQTRRKAPKIAPLLLVIFLFFTIIPIYYPSLRYNLQKLSEATFPYDSLGCSLRKTSLLEQGRADEPCPVRDNEVSNSFDHSKEGELAVKEEIEDFPRSPEKEQKNIETIINEPKREEPPEGRRKGKKRPGNQKKVDVPLLETRDHGNKVESKLLRKELNGENSCDLFSGEWIWNSEGPYYTNETCWAIQEHQNCMKFGRPDKEYLKWRWKPDECELPIFDPNLFLDIVRGKSLAFVGDSVARNHMQSLICLLSRVVYPEDVSKSINDQNRRYEYRDHDFNISMFWSPYLVKVELTDPETVTRPFKLYLDEFDPHWTTQIVEHDYVIISAGQWFMRPTYFYEKGKLVGCLYCPQSDNVKHLTAYFSYRRAFRTSFRAINGLEDFKGVTFLRTFAPSHFEGGAWDKGGKCSRTRPFKRNETSLADYAEKMYRIQLEELQIAKREGRRRKGKKFGLFDATKSMLLRPDGHPSRYGHWPQQKVSLPEDCVHWCLPGPIDSWNDFLLELLKREEAIDRQ